MTKKRLRNSIGLVLMLGSLLATQIPTTSTAERLSQRDEFQLDGDTLVKYTGTADTVSVPSAVKVIGEEAFADNENIVSVSLPSGLEKIAYAAFSGCNNLKKINIPDSCEEIGTGSFANCSVLEKVSIGKGIKRISNGVFVGCNKLKDISIDSPKFFLLDGVLYNEDKTLLIEVLPSRSKEKLDIPSSVTRICPYSIYGCDWLKTINLPSKLMEIPAYAFSGCNGLTSVSIPYSVKNIDAKAFENCANLCSVSIPESVSFIHDTAFDGCGNLNIDAPVGSYPYKWFQNFDKSNVAIIDNEDNDSKGDDETEEISNDTETDEIISENNQNVEHLPNNTYEDGLGQSKIVGRNAVVFIDNTKQTVKGNITDNSSDNHPYSEDTSLFGQNQDETVDSNPLLTEEFQEIIQKESKGKGLNLPKFAIIDNRIANKAFYNDSTIKEYVISDEITSIGDFSFARSNIESIVISSSVSNIGYGAFYHCDKLINVAIPSSVKNIEASAFDKTPWFENWKKSGDGDFLIVGDGILIGYKGSNSIVHIPDSVKSIAAETFMDHKGITEVYLPDSLEKVGEAAFKGCINLKYVSKGSYLTQIEDRAFYGCPIETVRIVDSVENIGLGAYDYTTALIDDSKKVVYFHGDKLPSISYIKTSTRLSNYNYRKNVFSGINVAVINNETIEVENTVLDNNLPGFRGLICTIGDKADAFNDGSLKIVGCNLSSEEAELFSVPNSMEIYGKTYNFNQNELANVLDEAKDGMYNPTNSKEGNISITGSDKIYTLKINRDQNVNEELIASYKRIYGEDVPARFISYNISLWENDNRVLLSKFGKRKLNVSMPLPENIPSANLHVICMDEDKQLEDIPYLLEENNGILEINIDINHTGIYGLYNANTNISGSENLDASPETGDYIHPKWILSIGLLAAAIATFLIKEK